jgi:hypothetical protein
MFRAKLGLRTAAVRENVGRTRLDPSILNSPDTHLTLYSLSYISSGNVFTAVFIVGTEREKRTVNTGGFEEEPELEGTVKLFVRADRT